MMEKKYVRPEKRSTFEILLTREQIVWLANHLDQWSEMIADDVHESPEEMEDETSNIRAIQNRVNQYFAYNRKTRLRELIG